MFTRPDGRNNDELRPLRISYDVYGYAAASVLLELGNTKVLCAVGLAQSVPTFLKGKKTGWLTAEYAMLPFSTPNRISRDDSCGKRKDGRAVEIPRLIGRSLRTVSNLNILGEQTITVDCEVLQADGGTRAACLTASCMALQRAQMRWQEAGLIEQPIITDPVAAIAIGLRENTIILDPSYVEDSLGDADFNFVLTKSGKIIEVQGSAEKNAIEWQQFQSMYILANQGVQRLFNLEAAYIIQTTSEIKHHTLSY